MTDTTPTSDSVRDKLIDLRMNKDWLKANEGQYTRDDWWQFCADESTMTLVEVLEFVESQLQAYKASVEKAYGGCHNCYGKGYATVIEYASGWDTDQDIGSPGGKVHFRQNPIRYCKCDRGRQLEKLMEALQGTTHEEEK